MASILRSRYADITPLSKSAGPRFSCEIKKFRESNQYLLRGHVIEKRRGINLGPPKVLTRACRYLV